MERRRNRRWVIVAAVCALVLGVGIGVVIALRAGGPERPPRPLADDSAAQSVGGAESQAPPPQEETPDWVEAISPRDYAAMALPGEMRAAWISFLEWKLVDIATEAAMRTAFGAMLDNCAGAGLNTVIVAVRPFGDAYYPSDIYPWGSLLSGEQGVDPGYDPLAVMVEEAHARGLRFEAWVNPYRVQDTKNGPDTLSADNPAVTHPEWVRDVDGNLWYDPGLPEVRRMVAEGVLEIVQGYDVDGIHFDDYFYPEFSADQVERGLDAAFDAESFALYGGGQALAGWRRQNNDEMVRTVYGVVKAANPTVSFGISVQGNNENNYQMMYADVRQWLSWEGHVDYVMPQLYWGFEYLTASGRDTFAFRNIAAQWAFFPRVDGVRLYAGLGAYRVGVGDGGSGPQDEWYTGHNLADMVAALREEAGFSGFALFRYEQLFLNDDPLAAQEVAALKTLLQ